MIAEAVAAACGDPVLAGGRCGEGEAALARGIGAQREGAQQRVDGDGLLVDAAVRVGLDHVLVCATVDGDRERLAGRRGAAVVEEGDGADGLGHTGLRDLGGGLQADLHGAAVDGDGVAAGDRVVVQVGDIGLDRIALCGAILGQLGRQLQVEDAAGVGDGVPLVEGVAAEAGSWRRKLGDGGSRVGSTARGGGIVAGEAKVAVEGAIEQVVVAQQRPVDLGIGDGAAEVVGDMHVGLDRLALGVGGAAGSDGHCIGGLAVLGHLHVAGGAIRAGGDVDPVVAERRSDGQRQAGGEAAEPIEAEGTSKQGLALRIGECDMYRVVDEAVAAVVVGAHHPAQLHGLAGPVDRAVGVEGQAARRLVARGGQPVVVGGDAAGPAGSDRCYLLWTAQGQQTHVDERALRRDTGHIEPQHAIRAGASGPHQSGAGRRDGQAGGLRQRAGRERPVGVGAEHGERHPGDGCAAAEVGGPEQHLPLRHLQRQVGAGDHQQLPILGIA